MLRRVTSPRGIPGGKQSKVLSEKTIFSLCVRWRT